MGPSERTTAALPLWPEAIGALAPPVANDSHKGTHGLLTVVAGSPALPGAAILALLGALRSGVGRLRWACAPATLAVAPPRPPQVMLATAAWDARQADGWADALVQPSQALTIGPGLGTDATAQHQVAALLRASRVPMCLDADALTVLSAVPKLWAHIGAHVVLTPHPQETARLTGGQIDAIVADPVGAAWRLAYAKRCVVVLKGAQSVVAVPHTAVYRVEGLGVEALAHGGTGDVLAGLLGGLLAKGMAPSAAARLAVLVHRKAGRHAARIHSHAGTQASDVAYALGAVWQHWQR